MSTALTAMSEYAAHEVTNQPHAPYGASADPALLEGLRHEGAGWAEADVTVPARAFPEES